MVLLNKEQIKELIPHREPFLLIDEIISLTPGEKCTARTYIRENDFWFPGHFPGYPVTPGVLIVEMLAQTGAVCVATKPGFEGKIALFSKIDGAKFRQQVVPGDVLELEISLVKLRNRVGVGNAVATVDGKVACTCQLTFMFDDKIK